MAASGYTPILIYGSTTTGNTPLAANLTTSASGVELAINAADGKLYYKNSSGVVTLLSASGGGPAGGSNTQVQFNSSGVLAGSSLFTWDGTTLVTPSHTTNTATTGSTNKGPLNYGTLSFNDTGIVQSAQTSVNSYFQNVMQNTSAGTAASAEFIAYNDQGTASTNYATVGINSSGYTGTGSINAPGYAYFLSASTDLVLGTIGANGIHFTTNSSATDALAISSAGAVSLPGGTANGVAYLNGSKVLTTGSALTFDGTNFATTGTVTANGRSKFIGASEPFSIYLRYNSSTNGVYLGSSAADTLNAYDSAGNPFYAFSAASAIFSISGSEQMRLTSTGLGIGTSSPNYSLTSYKTGAVANYLQVTSGATGAAAGNGLLLGVDASGNSVINAQGSINLYTYVAGVLRTTIDSSGNLGLGVTPSAWVDDKAVVVNFAALSSGYEYGASLAFNAYRSASNVWRYQTAATIPASRYNQTSGQHQWFNAPSGTAGNAITFTQAMTLDASGNLGIGTSSPQSDATYGGFTVNGTNGSIITLRAGNSNSGRIYTTSVDQINIDANGTASGTIIFRNGTGSTERARIGSDGTLSVGVTNGVNADGNIVAAGSIGTGQGAANTVAQINIWETTSGNKAGLWFGAMTNSNVGVIGSRTGSGAIAFQTYNGSWGERARIDSSGNLLVGTTNSSITSGAGARFFPTGDIASTYASSSSAQTTFEVYSSTAGAYRFYVDLAGTIHATSVVITAISDQLLKENVRDIDTGLDAIMALKPRRFDWKEGKGQDKKNAAGFIAQEFETVFPECVSTSKAGADGIEYKNINHETLIPTLVKAIQEQQALIESITKRLAAAGI